MEKNRIYLIFVFLFLIGCKEKIIFYEYNGVTITRIDKMYPNFDRTTFLYYGACNNEKSDCDEPSVIAERVVDNSITGLLKFNEDKTVEVINFGGGIFKVNERGNKALYYKDYGSHTPDSIKNNNTKVVLFDASKDVENQYNSIHNTKVKVNYYYESSWLK